VHQIWNEFLKIIEKEAGNQVVETWFKAVSLDRWEKETNAVFLLMPNQFVSKWIEEHYSTLIKTHLSRLLCTNNLKLFLGCKKNFKDDKKLIPASPLQRQILLETQDNSFNKEDKPYTNNDYNHTYKTTAIQVKTNNNPNHPVIRKKRPYNKLNENYTFESFVVGPHNSLAHAAGVAISQSLGKVYNPLFIYGETGLGKTHLLHAIGNQVKKLRPDSFVLYETSDNFICEFINSIKSDQTRLFRDKYQKADLLLLDDIQFFSKKEQTQEAFFHIFDSLQQQNKQVVFSSDTSPKDITGLQDRLKSRLQSGLIADVHMPTFETKMAILNKKAALHSIILNEEVTKFIASKPASSIRELEGYLIRLSAMSSLTTQTISLELAKQILKEKPIEEKQNIPLDTIAKTVAKYYALNVSDLKSHSRNKKLAFARQIAFYNMKKFSLYSLQVIGEYLGKKDHTTVLHAITKIERLKENDVSFVKKLKTIEEMLLK